MINPHPATDANCFLQLSGLWTIMLICPVGVKKTKPQRSIILRGEGVTGPELKMINILNTDWTEMACLWFQLSVSTVYR